MGVGFYVIGHPRAPQTAAPDLKALAAQVRELYATALPDPLLRERLCVVENDDSVTAFWHPAEEGLSIEAVGDGRWIAQAKTNTVGPGYHAFLVDVVDRLGDVLQVDWGWAGDPDDGDGDETGYALSRDFQALQNEMVAWLAAMGRHVLSEEAREFGDIRICLPDGPMPALHGRVASPMGVWDRDWFERVVADSDAAHDRAASFFPWWNAGFDAAFWRGIARVLAWSEVRWVSPRDDGERSLMRFVQACDERAGALDPALRLDAGTRDELTRLLAQPGIEEPAATGIGYKRGLSTFPLFGGWTIELPGHFRTHIERDGDNLQIEDGRRAVYVSAMRVNGRDGEPRAAQELIRTGDEEQSPEFSWHHRHVLGAASWRDDEDGESRHLHAKLAVDGRLLLLTITDGVDAPRDWSERVARSAFHPPPGE